MQQFEFTKEQPQPQWEDIQSFRKHPKPNKTLTSHDTNVAPTHHRRTSSQNRVPQVNLTDANKENIGAAVNTRDTKDTKQFRRNLDEELEIALANTNKGAGTQVFGNPMSQEQEIGTFSVSLVDSPGLKSTLHAVDATSNYVNEGSLEDFDFNQTTKGDQSLVNQLLDQKKKMEDDLKAAKQLVIKTRKENNQHIKQVQGDFDQERQGIHKHYQQLIEELKQKHQKELEEKDEEIETLNSLISTEDSQKSEKSPAKTTTEDRARLIKGYEDIIQSMRGEFEAELNKMSGYYQKKSQQSLEEKDKLLQEIAGLKEQVQELQAAMCPPTRREFGGDSSRLELETTNKILSAGHIPAIPIPMHKKPQHSKSIHNLLDKINKYMDENTIENEVSITNRKDLYKEIEKKTTVQGKSKPFIKPLNMAPLSQNQPKFNLNLKKSKGPTERPEDFDPDYFQDILAECEKNKQLSGEINLEGIADDEEEHKEADINSEEEDGGIALMNYSIKNLHNQLRFKPKCGDEK